MAVMSKAAWIGTCLLAVGLSVYSLTGSNTADGSSHTTDGAKSVETPTEPESTPTKTKAAEQSPPETTAPTLVDLSRKAEQKIRQAMQTKIDVTLKDVTLKDFIDLMARSGKIPIWIDETALREEGIATDEKLNDELHDVTIEQALNWTLRLFNLTWVIDDEIVKVTTEIVAEEKLTTRTYAVKLLLDSKLPQHNGRASIKRDLSLRGNQRVLPATGTADSEERVVPDSEASPGSVGPSAHPGTILKQIGGGGLGGVFPIGSPDNPRGDWLIELIASETSGPWWDIDGTGGNMEIVNDVLVVRQTLKVQEEVSNLLSALEEITAGETHRMFIASRPITYPHALDRQIQEAIVSRSSVDYSKTPLSSVVADLSKRYGIRIRVSEKSLSEEGIKLDEPITLSTKDVALGSMLSLMLEPLNLSYYVAEGAVSITTEIDGEEILDTTVYDVHDLVESEGDFDFLINAIRQGTRGPWMQIDGTGGSVSKAVPLGALAIRQTYRVHLEIQQLLADLRKSISTQPKSEPRPIPDPNAVTTQVYDLSKMNAASDLLTAIPRFVEPEAWEQNNKNVAIQQVGESLVVRQTREMHAKIERFLQQFGYFPRSAFGVGSQ